ncbi:uncharacterized protein ARB_07706 [Trichophyton benhamiae CBS 112371]|uniref:Uncharacterized protein n=1 Tax=Arthroderma benhamiae (strain ATCC MYA-4681 / CBS 112371) TaxID=663331 RepID=D4AU76_ARTBC|nr:uncharacterized protein ARB_07706 [Trichophyton benhamiae CBS 112371]EFE33346.1 hypothetical protein ARB_07706 [Trichophyton benhamiae CBS 112371]
MVFPLIPSRLVARDLEEIEQCQPVAAGPFFLFLSLVIFRSQSHTGYQFQRRRENGLGPCNILTRLISLSLDVLRTCLHPPHQIFHLACAVWGRRLTTPVLISIAIQSTPFFFTSHPAPFTDASHVMIMYTPCATLTPTWTKGKNNSPCPLKPFPFSLYSRHLSYSIPSWTSQCPTLLFFRTRYRSTTTTTVPADIPPFRPVQREEEIKENRSQKGNTAQMIKKNLAGGKFYIDTNCS